MRIFRLSLLFAVISRGLMAHAQEPASCELPAAFQECSRAATQKYQDQAMAILDGYQRIGRDFPAMGEHWINTGLLFDGKLDVAHPEILSYINISGHARLLGVAYALPLLKGETAPVWPSGISSWHDHFGTLDDETFLPQHHSGHGGDVPRVSMLHAWVWLDNPDGIFATDNWAIPYLRLSMEPPSHAPLAASRALSLAAGGTEYFRTSIDAAGQFKASDRRIIEASLQRVEAQVKELLSSRSEPRTMLTPSELDRLAGYWKEMWKAIDASVRRSTRQALLESSLR